VVAGGCARPSLVCSANAVELLPRPDSAAQVNVRATLGSCSRLRDDWYRATVIFQSEDAGASRLVGYSVAREMTRYPERYVRATDVHGAGCNVVSVIPLLGQGYYGPGATRTQQGFEVEILFMIPSRGVAHLEFTIPQPNY
jgi:hypothetical protein